MIPPFVGPGLGLGTAVGPVDPATPAVRTDPREDYVASGPLASWDAGDEMDRELALDGPTGWHGLGKYRAMYRTPAAGSSFNALRAAVLAAPIGLLPAVKRAGRPAAPGQEQGDDVEAQMAAQVADSNRRLLDRWEVSADEVAWELMEAMYLGHVMAEVEADDVSGGPDDGLLAVTGLRTLPRENYRFLVDKAGRVARIGALAIDGRWRQFATDSFAWLTWDPHRGDPRGRSCFAMAYYHWRMLMDLWPEVYKGYRQFGVPMMWGHTAPGAAQMMPETNDDGSYRAGGRPVSAQHLMLRQMVRMAGGSKACGPDGSGIEVIESSKDSSVAAGGITILEGQVIRTILLQIRATVEAKHGSKADSETGQDILGTLVRFVRKWLERFFRSVLMKQNEWNYGIDIARRLTPLVNMGEHEHQDFASEVGAVASLFQSGFFQADQLGSLDERWGFQQRTQGGVRVGPNGAISDELPPEPVAGTAAPEAAPAEEGVAA